ncbi:MAG: ABC transporter permease [Anaerolineae bacterium]|nr:ABC transporter permease [Anaerolineae bacterium]
MAELDNEKKAVAQADAKELAFEEEEIISGEEEKIYVASYSKLMWWRFRKHKMAMVSAVVVLLLYLVAVFCEFVAPYDPEQYFLKYKDAPPTKIHIFDAEGRIHMPFVHRIVRTRDEVTLRNLFNEDTTVRYPITFFVRGTEYEMWGLFKMDLHLFGLPVPHEEQGIFVLGADRLGRDLFSRMCYGARISLSIGLAGVLLSVTLGIVLGGISGYYGGKIDIAIQRMIEFIRTVPNIPLWMALSAALPKDWPIIRIYFGITILLSLISWTGMARVVRGRFLAMREEDFVLAARLAGSNEMRIILRHMLPSFLSHIIASLTLSIPGMILSETGLSYLGLGLRAPAISWGVLLREAQNLRSLALVPWVLLPALAVILTVMAFNFVGDGLRDAADPYAR